MAGFYLDEGIPKAAVSALQGMGHTALHARTAIPKPRVPDHVHLAAAASSNLIVVTKDSDFVALHRAWLYWGKAWQLNPPPQHAGIMIVAGGWGPDVIAQEVDDLLQAQQPVATRLFRWRTGTGWMELF